MPAHISLLYPFLPVSSVTDEVLAALRSRLSAFPAFDFSLARTARFLEVLFLDPDPSEPFRELVRALGAGSPPYEARFTDILPHLTVAHSTDPSELERFDAEVSAKLPIRCRATETWLMTEDATGDWRIHARFPLGNG